MADGKLSTGEQMTSDDKDEHPCVEVSSDGTWQPSVTLAGDPHAIGTWEVAPEIGPLMVMRRAGGPTTDDPDRTLVLAGVLSRVGSLVDILTLIHMAGLDGALHVDSVVDGGEVNKVLFFRRGVYLAGRSSLVADRLGNVLVREGYITGAQRDECMAEVAEGKRLGVVLVASKLLTTPQVYEGLRKQGESVFYSTLGFRQGTFRLVTPLDMTEVPSMLRLNVQNLLLEGMRRMDEATRAEREQQEQLQRSVAVSDAQLPEDAAARITNVYNDALTRLFVAIPEAGRERLLLELREFVNNSVPYRALFKGVEVAGDGTLDSTALRANDNKLGENRLRILQDALNELFFFIVFAADELLVSEVEVKLLHDVARALSRLPKAKPG